MSRAQKKAVDAVIEAMRSRPLSFSCGEHRLVDHKTGIHYWVNIGPPGIYTPYKMSFGLWHGMRFTRALNAWKAATMIHATENATRAITQ